MCIRDSIYFSLKDESGLIACVMFAGSRSGLSFRMRDGQQVIAGGSIGVYERDGKYQLYAKEILLDGAGPVSYTHLSKDVKIFKALCDTKRLMILDYLKSGEKCACVLIENMNIGQSALSYHMKILCDLSLIHI